MFTIHQTGQRPIDLEALVLNGKLAHKMDRAELCRELTKLGVSIDGNMGTQSLLINYARHLQQQLVQP